MGDTGADSDGAAGGFTTIVVDADELRATTFRQEAAALGFEVVGELHNPVDALHLAELVQPHLVITGNDFWGMTGVQLAADLRALDPAPEVVLVLRDLAAAPRAHEVGCFDVAPEGDLPALGRVLTEVEHFLRTGERRKGGDRREGADRRQHQDWQKVTHERRSGQDRRQLDRRDGPVEADGSATS